MVLGRSLHSPKVRPPELCRAVNTALAAKEGDLILFQFGKTSLVHMVLANLRGHVAKKLGLIPEVGSHHDRGGDALPPPARALDRYGSHRSRSLRSVLLCGAPEDDDAGVLLL